VQAHRAVDSVWAAAARTCSRAGAAAVSLRFCLAAYAQPHKRKRLSKEEQSAVPEAP